MPLQAPWGASGGAKLSAIQHIEVAPADPRRFVSVLSESGYQDMLTLIEEAVPALRDRIVWNVNSTARGGGVVELLRPLVSYCRGVGVDCRWTVISAQPEFFEITKRLHNRLHGFEGDGGELAVPQRATYERALAVCADELTPLVRKQDVVILHDPQTGGLVEAVKATGATVIWRCHVGLDHANARAREAWRFLRPYVAAADAYVFSRAAFAWEGLDTEKVAQIQPSIDVFSPKNEDLGERQISSILNQAGLVRAAGRVPPSFTRADGSTGRVRRRVAMTEAQALRPDDRVVTQVSRWDRLKDPLGVIQGFVDGPARLPSAHLLLVGPATESVADDPEGAGVFAAVCEAWAALPEASRRRVHLAALPMEDSEENAAIVNAIQRRSQVVVQKSLAEGFGLTVAEAMWKRRPMVASRIGGIQDQVENEVSGLLLDDPRDLVTFGELITQLLTDPERAARMGAVARAHVERSFLGPHHLGRYFDLIRRLI